MKYSQFNTIIPYDDKYALYNSLSQKVLFMLPELKDLLDGALYEGMDNLAKYHPSFYDYLIVQEYLVKDNEDEVEKVKKLSRSIDESEKMYFLTINPTMNCNFNCWYCYETHIKQSRLNNNTIIRINKFITNTANSPTLESFSLSFFGGEPLLYFKKSVIPIIDHFINECEKNKIVFDIGFTTNGYLINDDFLTFFKQKNIRCALQITLDGYKEKHDLVRFVDAKRGSYKEIINNIRLLITNSFFVRLRINYTDENIENTELIVDEFSDIPKELKETFLIFDFHKVWQSTESKETVQILDKNLQIINNKGVAAISNTSPNNVINSCYADKRNSVTINYNAEIFKCTARDFTKENREGYLDEAGSLIWENGALEKRMNAKFRNKPCLSCKILPLCNGGCSQLALENLDKDYCVYNGDESEKDRVVSAKIGELLISHNISNIPKVEEIQYI